MHPNNVIHRRRAERAAVKQVRLDSGKQPADGGDLKKEEPKPVETPKAKKSLWKKK